jgi:hypothetical protein
MKYSLRKKWTEPEVMKNITGHRSMRDSSDKREPSVGGISARARLLSYDWKERINREIRRGFSRDKRVQRGTERCEVDKEPSMMQYIKKFTLKMLSCTLCHIGKLFKP